MFGFSKKGLASLAKPMPINELRKRTKILVIDDDDAAFPIEALRGEGYTIEHWCDVESMERLERGDFDIVVLDISGVARRFAPDEEGFGVLQHLKQHNPTQVIVAFSGQSFDLSKQEFFRLADDTMPKPVSVLKCKQVLDQLMESRMTVRHMWGTVVALMQAEGVPEKSIKQLETKVAALVRRGDRTNVEEIVRGVVDGAELCGKVIGGVLKIVALAGA